MKAKSLLLGFLVGGVAAGITTLLTAPASGRTTRKYLQENKDLLMSNVRILKDDLMDLKNSASQASMEGKAAISSLSSDLKHSIADWKNAIRPNKQELQKEMKKIEDTISELELSLNRQKTSQA
ncbi:hypothetical protein CU633_07685 [Bacillus sp. V3-13]|uniref:YtxH domain-containing protein n=1 Tax=Bacillus sp. V3-13 TaxID=2053728 RepID=UPI000C75A0B3|nr:YtxH domain-containing protein [Bacillus sp. V3-13]PLR77979.1 hypothetical protein CU633_07685 [Bacillus sp. V3-13]